MLSLYLYWHISSESGEEKYLGPDNIVGLEILSVPLWRKHTIDPANPPAKSKCHIALPESVFLSSEINYCTYRGYHVWRDQYYFISSYKQSWRYLEKLVLNNSSSGRTALKTGKKNLHRLPVFLKKKSNSLVWYWIKITTIKSVFTFLPIIYCLWFPPLAPHLIF